MSDLFHERVTAEFVEEVVAVMRQASWHTFQVLTKRPERARDLLLTGMVSPLPSNVWLGVSIENSRFAWRADVLRETPAAVRFVSAEPLLGSLFEAGGRRRSLELNGIDWLIVGGESGPYARPTQISWVRELRDACEEREVAFFFKQWGGRTPKAGGRILDDHVHDEMPRSAFSATA
jgi:protein gp37